MKKERVNDRKEWAGRYALLKGNMSFLSVTFIAFCTILIFLYYIVPKRMQKYVLLAGNYIFYMWTNYIYIFFILFTTLNTFFFARELGRLNQRQRNLKESKKNDQTASVKARIEKVIKTKRKVMYSAIFLNFGILVILKYGADAVGIYDSIAKAAGFDRIGEVSVIIPLGISFYTFQTMSYILDVYRNKYQPEKSLFEFALFVSFFPQLVQGPISRYEQLMPQLKEEHRFFFKNISYGLQLMLWGFFKKLVIADRISVMSEAVFNGYDYYKGSYVIFIAVFYSLQVYADFSAGMDIAGGVAECLGIRLTDNFRRPFFADNLTEYWRRWHISLNDWLRDYVFYPLTVSKSFIKMGKFFRKIFGNTFGKYFAVYIATFIVRIINAIWHGGSPKYFLNGFYNGLIIIIGMQCRPLSQKLKAFFHVKQESVGWKLFGILRTFMLISMGRIIVKAENIRIAYKMIQSVFTTFNPWIWFDGSLFLLGVPQREFYILIFALIILLLVSLLQEKGICVRDKIQGQGLVARWGIYYAAILLVLLCGVYGIGYDASGFIYMQF